MKSVNGGENVGHVREIIHVIASKCQVEVDGVVLSDDEAIVLAIQLDFTRLWG